MTPLDQESASRPFRFIRRDREIGRLLNQFADQIASDCEAQYLLRGSPPARCAVLADIKTRTKRKGSLYLRRFYWSAQRWSQGDSPGFNARTLSYYSKCGEAVWNTFPNDPELISAGRALARAKKHRVLRYVPLRRLTFLCEDETGAPVIAKIKRPERYSDAVRRLEIANKEIEAAPVSFKVAALRSVEPSDCLFTQNLCDGVCLADIIAKENANHMLAQVGRIHAELHGLSGQGLPDDDDRSRWATTQENIAWLRYLSPDHGDRLLACIEALAKTRADGQANVFCHGDFVCSQLLVAPGSWSVVDFDRCNRGSRFRDIGIFLASLSTDAKCFAAPEGECAAAARDLASAEDAYLTAYAERAAIKFDPIQLNWHRGCAEIHYLMLMLKKDRYEPHAFAAGIERLETACKLLG